MKTELVLTTNNLADIVRFLKEQNIVCLYCTNNKIFYYAKSSCEKINNEKLIYINCNKMPSLLDEEEWPWYIKDSGFVEYTSINILPIEEDNIYFFSL